MRETNLERQIFYSDYNYCFKSLYIASCIWFNVIQYSYFQTDKSLVIYYLIGPAYNAM